MTVTIISTSILTESLEMEATVMRSCFEDMSSAYNGKI